ncbi:MAG: type II toxin-antitoxin system VapC family toxin [Anaerolineaceae bacterium]|nr:type II toxin-antitoxin system VapC family toxin [Anaerolineaceae bacterium]
MNYLLDTCLISEFTKRDPNPIVIQWLDSMDEEKLFLSAITIGEIQHGIQRLADSKCKNELLVWMNNGITQRFGSRILSLETETMLRWGSLVAEIEKIGHPMPVMDALIAATALTHNLVLVTRNVSDFLNCGVQMMNPWEE